MRAPELGPGGGRLCPPALAVHEERVDERHKTEEHQRHVHLERGEERRREAKPGDSSAQRPHPARDRNAAP